LSRESFHAREDGLSVAKNLWCLAGAYSQVGSQGAERDSSAAGCELRHYPKRDRQIADAMATLADGFGEREAATLMMLDQWQREPWRGRTLGADKAYDSVDFVDLMRELNITPHVTQNLARPGGSAIDGRTTRHEGYAMSQHARPRIVENETINSARMASDSSWT